MKKPHILAKEHPLLLLVINPVLFFRIWFSRRRTWIMRTYRKYRDRYRHNGRFTRKKMRPYIRAGTIKLEEAFSYFGQIKILYGQPVRVRGRRYRCYLRKGTTCISCGIKGQYFAVEKNIYDDTVWYHLNLYAVEENGNERLMTVDHIHPKAKGGTNRQTNLQPMCCRCNTEKADKIPGRPKKRKKRHRRRKKKMQLELDFAPELCDNTFKQWRNNQ